MPLPKSATNHVCRFIVSKKNKYQFRCIHKYKYISMCVCLCTFRNTSDDATDPYLFISCVLYIAVLVLIGCFLFQIHSRSKSLHTEIWFCSISSFDLNTLSATVGRIFPLNSWIEIFYHVRIFASGILTDVILTINRIPFNLLNYHWTRIRVCQCIIILPEIDDRIFQKKKNNNWKLMDK